MNEDRKYGVRLLRLFLLAAAFVSGVQTYSTLRDLILHAPSRTSTWLIPAWLRFPQGVGLVLNVLFELLLIWLIFQIYRSAVGTERILLISFFGAEFLSQFQALLPTLVTPIRILAGLLLFTAFLSSLYLLYATWKVPADESLSGQSPQR